MALTPGKALLNRSLNELGIAPHLISIFNAWAAVVVEAVGGKLTGDALSRRLETSYVSKVVEPLMQAAEFLGDQAEVEAYLEQLDVFNRVVSTVVAVRDLAELAGMTPEAIDKLMRQAVRIDGAPLVELPQSIAHTVRPVPGPPSARLGVNQRFMPSRSVFEHPRIFDKEMPLVKYGNTWANTLDSMARTLATRQSGFSARAEAMRTGSQLRWVTMKDDRVRPTHVHAQGQTVEADEDFWVGGYPMKYPGDPFAPLDETIGCRCVLAVVSVPQRRYVQSYIPPSWLNASATPGQVRAPKGTRIGGQWIDTPSAIMDALGWAGEKPNEPDRAYTTPDVAPPDWDATQMRHALDAKMPITQFTDEERKAVEEYTMNTFGAVNAMKRGEFINRKQEEWAKDVAGRLDSMLAKSVTPGDLTVYRGAGRALPSGADAESLIGKVISDKAYLSTSVDRLTGNQFSGDAVMKIAVPKGSSAIWADRMSLNEGEMEMILPPSTPLVITGVEHETVMDMWGNPKERSIISAIVGTPDSITASAPGQARAPKGVTIGGQWIDTPAGIVDSLGAPKPGETNSVDVGGHTFTGTVDAPHGREGEILAHPGFTTPPLFRSTKGDPESSAAYRSAIEQAKAANPYGASVYVYDQAEYEDMDLWLSKDGKAGIALHGDDIVSAFSSPDSTAKGFVLHGMATAQAAGGKRADAFDTILPGMYAKAGMEVVGRVPWDDDYAPDGWDPATFAAYNNGKPDVVFMKLNPDGWWGTYEPGQGQTVSDYESGQELTASAERGVDLVVGPLGGTRGGDILVRYAESLKTQPTANALVPIVLTPSHPDILRQTPVNVLNPGATP